MRLRSQFLLGSVLLLLAGQPIYSQMLDEQESEPASTPEPLNENKSFPIFKFNENQWFELTIPDSSRPDIGKNIEEERNWQNAIENSDRDALFSDDLKFLNQLHLRYHFRFN